MKMYAKRFLRDSLAIIYFIIGWKLGGCLLSEQPRRGEADRGPNHGADQFADEASHEPADATTNAPAPFVENILAGRVDVQDAHGVDATGKFDGGAGYEALSAEVQRGGVVIPREVKGDVARAKRVGGAENPIVPFVHGTSIAQPETGNGEQEAAR